MCIILWDMGKPLRLAFKASLTGPHISSWAGQLVSLSFALALLSS